MKKFFKKKPEICSICRKENVKIVKKIRKGLMVWCYCQECYDGYYLKVQERVMKLVDESKKRGKKIGMQDTIKIVKELTPSTTVSEELQNKHIEGIDLPLVSLPNTTDQQQKEMKIEPEKMEQKQELKNLSELNQKEYVSKNQELQQEQSSKNQVSNNAEQEKQLKNQSEKQKPMDEKLPDEEAYEEGN